METCLLMIYIPPSLEESLEDWLLEAEGVTGFSSSEAFGHGAGHHGMSLLEQVTGHQRRIQFVTCLSRPRATTLIQELCQRFSGTSLHCFLLPVLEEGKA